MRVITVTLNPALDKTASLERLRPGELNRLRDVVVDAGGKGINVSKMIAALGGESLATGFVGGGSGEEIIRSLSAIGIRHDFIRVAAATRTNLKVLDRGGGLTELNEPGPRIDSAEFRSLLEKLDALASSDALFVFSGSLPDGLGPQTYADMIRQVHQAGAKAFLDADGASFAQALVAKPDFIKPNRFELLQYFGLDSDDGTEDLLPFCRGLLDKGIGRIAVSMGDKGALFVSHEDAFLCPGLAVSARSSVGAGDSMVGAIAHAAVSGLSWRDTASLAMAASAGAVTTVGTKPPSRELVDGLLPRVRFTAL
ncbi:MAG: 1-phosphofructokinase [Planctomycetota bacterium]|jgi:1-phosphofructokinase|nr:1-phosphofructokinase [Planctomycetota bacterium]